MTHYDTAMIWSLIRKWLQMTYRNQSANCGLSQDTDVLLLSYTTSLKRVLKADTDVLLLSYTTSLKRVLKADTDVLLLSYTTSLKHMLKRIYFQKW